MKKLICVFLMLAVGLTAVSCNRSESDGDEIPISNTPVEPIDNIPETDMKNNPENTAESSEISEISEISGDSGDSGNSDIHIRKIHAILQTADEIRAGTYPVKTAYENPAILQVGPDKQYKTPAAAIAKAKSGDIVEIDAGDYYNAGAVAQIGSAGNSLKDLTIRGVGGRANMIADADTKLASGGQGVWAVYANGAQIENIGFSGAAFDQSASGVRINAMNIIFRNCYIAHNNMGALSYNDNQYDGGYLIFIDCEFDGNGNGSGSSHNVYIGNGCEKFWLIDSYSTGVDNGYLIKTRAKNSYIINSSLICAPNSKSGVPLNVPIGGNLYVIGSVLQQNNKQDSRLIRYDEESTASYYQPGLDYYLFNDTFITYANGNDCLQFSGSYRKGEYAPVIYNCIFAVNGGNPGKFVKEENGNYIGNVDSVSFIDPKNYDFRLSDESDAAFVGKGFSGPVKK